MTTQTKFTHEQIRATIFENLGMIAPEADFDLLHPSDNVQKVLDIDSFDFLNFLIGLNEALGVEIPESDYQKLGSLEEMIGYLAARLG